MRRAALTSLLLCACGPASFDEAPEWAERADPIINGTLCEDGEEPTTVAILIDATIEFFGMQQEKKLQCTGTLIAPDVVLAAAHCVDASLLTLGFGSVLSEAYYVSLESDLGALADGDTTEFPADAVKALSWVPHPDFNINSMNNVSGPGVFHDIALIFLESPILDVKPEAVVTHAEAAQISVGDEVTIAGYGMTVSVKQTWPPQPPPRGISGKKMCATSFINELGTHEMQVGDDATTSRKCHGDSGGPSFMEVDTPFENKRRVIGVTSHAYDQRDCDVGGLDTRVDAYLEWIDEVMRLNCLSGERVWCDIEGLPEPDAFEQEPEQPDAGQPLEPDAGNPDPGSGGDTRDGCDCGTTPFGALALLGLVMRRRR